MAGLFEKFKVGLKKTRNAFNERIEDIIYSFNKIDEDLYEELEEILILADIGIETTGNIISRLKEKVDEKREKNPEKLKVLLEEVMIEFLADNDNSLNLDENLSVILVIGVNGVGKTTSIGKLAYDLKLEGKDVILAAADTFRAGAIDQLGIWADRAKVDLIKHSEGADPSAVVYDAILAAKARKKDVLICDTAGRLHNKVNLMNELNKIYRIIERELPESKKETLLVVDATTGQNAVSQVNAFNESAKITGLIMTKLDGTAKGGIVLAIHGNTKIPIKFIGIGEKIDDLKRFESEDFVKAILE